MTYLLMGCAAVGIIILLAILTEKVKSKNEEKKSRNKTNKNVLTQNRDVLMINCPLCNTPLAKGENLVSKVYRPMNVPDQRCTINGCPHCYPQVEPGVKRQCPCCKKEVPITGYLVARLFNYKDNKKHVRVTGCSRCCEK